MAADQNIVSGNSALLNIGLISGPSFLPIFDLEFGFLKLDLSPIIYQVPIEIPVPPLVKVILMCQSVSQSN